MAVYLESYLSFSISINVVVDIHHAGSFRCQGVTIELPEGKRMISMSCSEMFRSELDAKVFGLDWAKTWIDKNTSAGKT